MRLRSRSRRFGWLLLVVLTCSVCWKSSAQTTPIIVAEHGPNASPQFSKHYVVLVSLDGFRYDYAKLYQAKHLMALAAEGASAPKGMIPSFPSVTFPNHYTIVTGLYPEHHGIVGNSFYDPARDQTYAFDNVETLTDGSWYGGTPLWSLAEQQGLRSACYFWPGSEAEIQGERPTYYLKFDAKVPNEQRVAQVLDWLRLPPERRPHFITVYFGDADHVGHQFGPSSPEEKNAVRELDKTIGNLAEGIRALKLPVDLIVLADHGMVEYQGEFLNLSQFDPEVFAHTKRVGPSLYPKSEAEAQSIFTALRGKSDKFVVYRRADVPAYLHYDANPRSGDPIIIETGPYLMGFADIKGKPFTPKGGNHGYDPTRVPEMMATFIAVGPDIKPGISLTSFENVDVYPLIAHILGLDITHLKTGPIDGDLTVLRSVLKEE